MKILRAFTTTSCWTLWLSEILISQGISIIVKWFQMFCFEGHYGTRNPLKIYYNFKYTSSSNNWVFSVCDFSHFGALLWLFITYALHYIKMKRAAQCITCFQNKRKIPKVLLARRCWFLGNKWLDCLHISERESIININKHTNEVQHDEPLSFIGISYKNMGERLLTATEMIK